MDDDRLDLILALAQGGLAPADARAAEASLSAEEQQELAAQRMALNALRTAEPVRMTEAERAKLHRGLSLTIADEDAAAAATSARRGWFPRLAWALAGAAVFVAVVVSAGVIVGDLGDDDSAADISAVAETTTTVAAADTTTTTAAASAQLAPEAGATEEFSAADDRVAGDADATTTTAATEDFVVRSFGDGILEVGEIPLPVTNYEVSSDSAFDIVAESLAEFGEAPVFEIPAFDPALFLGLAELELGGELPFASTNELPCLPLISELGDSNALAAFVGEFDGVAAVAYILDSGEFVFYVADSCSQLPLP